MAVHFRLHPDRSGHRGGDRPDLRQPRSCLQARGDAGKGIFLGDFMGVSGFSEEGFDMFDNMLQNIDKDVSIFLLKAEIRQNIERKEKRKKLLTNEHHPENNYIKNTFNTYNTFTHHPLHSNLNVNNSNSYLLNNKSNIQMNNKRILNINQLLRQEKEKIEKILSPIRPEIKREEISHNEYQITNTMNQLNKIHSLTLF